MKVLIGIRAIVLAYTLGFAAIVGNTTDVTDQILLPNYQPGRQVSGVLRIWGTPQMGPLLEAWQVEFRRYHPDMYFSNVLMGSGSAMLGLEEVVADIAIMGRKIAPYDTYGIWRRSHLLPIEIEVATGGYKVPHKSSAVIVYVHKDNPLTRLTLHQLDSIFGAQRTGGWIGMKWSLDSARSEEENIRTWGELGLEGEWADAPIRPYGPPGLHPGGMSYFQVRVMGGADTRNEDFMEYADRQEMIKALEQDRYGIGYSITDFGSELVKPLALAETDNEPYVLPTKSSVASRAYALSRPVYIYFAPDFPNGDPREVVDPALKEFLRYILSRQGQAHVAGEGVYLPLTNAVLREQLRKLDQPPTKLKRLSP